jgi:uncharacterized FlgJ-related protein
MLYYFDKDKLKFRVARKTIITTIALPIILATASVVTISAQKDNEVTEKKNKNLIDIRHIEREQAIVMLNVSDAFTEEKLKDYILELNIKFPDIAFAQARYESGNWGENPGARIFKSNNNIFGMKEAVKRPTTCRGTQRGHAFYDHWRMSVMDYAMWQHAYTKPLNTRKSYIAYLKKNYAMGTYESLMQIIRETRRKYPELIVRDYPKLER